MEVHGKKQLSALYHHTTQDKKKALLIWKKFFNDDFFESQVENVAKSAILTPNQPWRT